MTQQNGLYIVKRGDTLWDIAAKELGSPWEWPRLWKFNNRPSTVRVTGRDIPDPDLIYVGQRLAIPRLPAQPIPRPKLSGVPRGYSAIAGGATDHAAGPGVNRRELRPSPGPPAAAPSTYSLRDAVRDLRSPISFKYRLDDLKLPPIDAGKFIFELKMTGDLLLQTHQAYPMTYVTQRQELEAKFVTEAQTTYTSILTDTRLIYDSKKNTLTYRSMLVTENRLGPAPSTAVGIQIDSGSVLPKLRFEYRFPKLGGSLPIFKYVATDVKIVVEMTPKPEVDSRRERGPQESPRWELIIGSGLVVTAAGIAIATLIEDVLTWGTGIWNDIPSLAAALAMLQRGLSMMGPASRLIPAAAPAVVPVVIRIENAHAPSAHGH